MADFSTFEYGTGTVYGPTLVPATGAESVIFLEDNVIEIQLDGDVVVDSAYYDVANYSVVFADDLANTDVRVREVLRLEEPDALTTSVIRLRTDRHQRGTRYQVNVAGLHARNGSTLGSTTAQRTATATKADTMLQAVHKFLDRRPSSIAATIVMAISRSDELIGGSFDEPINLPVPDFDLLATLDDNTLVTLDGFSILVLS